MKQFAALFEALDASTSTNQKVKTLVQYFEQAAPEDAAWAVYFLGGGKPRRTVPTKALRAAALQVSRLPDWLFEESYQAVGDLAETIALILPPVESSALNGEAEDLSWWMTQRILPLRDLAEEDRIAAVQSAWAELPARERFLFVKLVGGGFRVGVSKLLVTRALAQYSGLDAKLIATRMMGYHEANHRPNSQSFQTLIDPTPQAQSRLGQPLPFFLAHPLQAPAESLGSVSDWLLEWKYDGIRAQLVKQAGRVWIWSRGEELITEQFPELQTACASLPDETILDGEILVWAGDKPAGFSSLQTRLNRKVISKKLQQDAPVVFMAYDCLMDESVLLTDKALRIRRAHLEALVARGSPASEVQGWPRLLLSEPVVAQDWAGFEALREQSRVRGVEGFMVKHWESRYGVGRTKGAGLWWKWKVDPMTVDCVLVYAQRGHGRRANLYTDFTFAVWDQPRVSREQAQAVFEAIARGEKVAETTARGLPCLVPFAKAYSGLSDEEFKRVDREIRKNTVDKFGPVRTVKPTLVFELGFEAISRSSRHKSGLAVRFPRMLRIRNDKPIEQADTLASLQDILP